MNPIIDHIDIFGLFADEFLDTIEGMTRDGISDDRLLSLHPFFEGEGSGLLEIKMTRHSTSTLTHVKKSHLRSFLL